ncbi:MAG: hypothetical protein D6790_20380 [Caldilineae bacterium]|nr:MAG: hypothetical protein D6790_20380 [Caldilineae bacterium]
MSRITQLHEGLELLSEGDPPRHSLFVLGRVLGQADQLLVVDPPEDLAERFTLPQQAAVLFTGPALSVDVPLLETLPGDAAHVSIGPHLLDIHAQQFHRVVYLPALGILWGGGFGSDLTVPEIAEGSSGDDELETLRLLARLLKGRRVELYIPRTGSLVRDRVEVMGRLAEDVGYLHGLRRVIPAAARRGEALERIEQMAATLLPENRRTQEGWRVHDRNVQRLFAASSTL